MNKITKYSALIVVIIIIVALCYASGLFSNRNSNTNSEQSTTKQFGYITSIDNSSINVKIAEMINCTIVKIEGECPNGFAILDKNKTETFTINDDAEVVFQTMSHDSTGNLNMGEKATVAKFKEMISKNTPNHIKVVPYWIYLEDGKVVKIEEQYLP